VNFAPYDWLPAGLEADERYRMFARGSVFRYYSSLIVTIGLQCMITKTYRMICCLYMDSHQRLLFTLLRHKETLDVATTNE
jgi:hypothetical protein